MRARNQRIVDGPAFGSQVRLAPPDEERAVETNDPGAVEQ
jgi:hypothetical protein